MIHFLNSILDLDAFNKSYYIKTGPITRNKDLKETSLDLRKLKDEKIENLLLTDSKKKKKKILGIEHYIMLLKSYSKQIKKADFGGINGNQ
ncbi:MAG: hypothetical protein Q9M97_05710 [Candidatus Gracilibacteria bacterium]|nr:hypothetical protein [Candidatus Gracilibacteria bacterium]